MLSVNRLRRRPHPLVLFAAVTLVSVGGLAWLSWRVIVQDQALERQRWQDKCELAAGNAVTILTLQLDDLLRMLRVAADGRSSSILGPDKAILVFRGELLEVAHGIALPYLPAPREVPDNKDRFLEAESMEFRQKQPLRAAELYQRLAANENPAIRAGALIRLARTYRRADLVPQALETYAALEKMDGAHTDGEAAEMMARLGKAEVFVKTGDSGALQREATKIARALSESRWFLRRGSYEMLVDQTRAWLGGPLPFEALPKAIALANVGDTVWRQWKDGLIDGSSSQGRKSYWMGDSAVLALWQTQPGRLVLLVVTAELFKTALIRLTGDGERQVTISLEDSEGHPFTGMPKPASSLGAIKTGSATGLPWTVHASPARADVLSGKLSGQGRLLLAALGLMILFIVSATGFVARSISRELAVARLQTDFVAAVSHEFRSPLTTIMQLSELLVRGRVSGDDKRQSFYEMTLRESQRLHALVEGLLNFGRFESGRYEYRFQTVDLAELARGVIAEFTASAAQAQPNIEFQHEGPSVPVRADRDAIGRVLSNLLDNAVKYSPGQSTIWVAVENDAGRALFSVRDSGIGIPEEERKTIFTKFVRGAGAKERSIQGTGIGLAMAQMIMKAHGGTIEVESAPGQGSTFRLLLPLERNA